MTQEQGAPWPVECKHGTFSVCALCDEEDAEHDRDMAIQARADAVAAERQSAPLPPHRKVTAHGRMWIEEDMHAYAEQQIAAEKRRGELLRTVAEQVLRDMLAQEVLPEWHTLLDEALRAGEKT